MDINAFILSNPKTAIIILSFAVTLLITIVSHFMTDKELMRSIKAKQKSLREEMKKFKDDPAKMMEINKKMMEDMPHQLKQSMKISLVTILPLLFVFKWLRNSFALTAIASSWIWWYIGASIVFSMVLRKMFKLD